MQRMGTCLAGGLHFPWPGGQRASGRDVLLLHSAPPQSAWLGQSASFFTLLHSLLMPAPKCLPWNGDKHDPLPPALGTQVGEQGLLDVDWALLLGLSQDPELEVLSRDH